MATSEVDTSQWLSLAEQEMTADGVPLTEGSAWNFLYRYVMAVRAGYPGIVEKNYLSKAQVWQRKASLVTEWLAKRRHLANSELSGPEVLARLGIIRRPEVLGEKGAENATGKALEDALAFLIERFCPGVKPLVRCNIKLLSGYEMVTRHEVNEVDLALFTRKDFRVVLSCFWTTRRDRVSSDLFESSYLRKRRPDLQISVVTNEFHYSILKVLLEWPEIDSVYHVNKECLLAAYAPEGESVSVADLAKKDPARKLTEYLTLKAGLKDLDDLFRDVRAIHGEEVPTRTEEEQQLEEVREEDQVLEED